MKINENLLSQLCEIAYKNQTTDVYDLVNMISKAKISAKEQGLAVDGQYWQLVYQEYCELDFVDSLMNSFLKETNLKETLDNLIDEGLKTDEDNFDEEGVYNQFVQSHKDEFMRFALNKGAYDVNTAPYFKKMFVKCFEY